jgi:hypothetical protein
VFAGIHWLVGTNQAVLAGHATNASQVDMNFIDLLAWCGGAVTKVGCCTFVEAACNGVGLVSAARADWPESAGLIDWAQQHACFALVDEGIESDRGLRTALAAMLEAPRKAPVALSGIREAVDIVAEIAGLRQTATGP